MAAVNQFVGLGPFFSFRSHDMAAGRYYYYYYTDMEKRQLFLRSYQFSRKKSVTERFRGSFFRVKRVILVRLRSAKKLRKMVWSRIKHGFFFTTASRRRRSHFLRLHNNNYASSTAQSSSCFW